MFSPIYEDVSGLLGRPGALSCFGSTPADSQFSHANFLNGSSLTATPQIVSHTPLQQRLTGNTTLYSLLDAGQLPQQPLSSSTSSQTPYQQQGCTQATQQQQQQRSLSVNGADVGMSVFPYNFTFASLSSLSFPVSNATGGAPPALPPHATANAAARGTTVKQHQGCTRYVLASAGASPSMTAAGTAVGVEANMMQLAQQPQTQQDGPPPQPSLGQPYGASAFTLEAGRANSTFATVPSVVNGGFYLNAAAAAQPVARAAMPSNSVTNAAHPDYPLYAPAHLSYPSVDVSSGMMDGAAEYRSGVPHHLLTVAPSANVGQCGGSLSSGFALSRGGGHAVLGSHVLAKPILEVFDPDFKFIYDVPTHCVVHLPPARLNITRLVLCRNYRRYEPQSCTMGGGCKFVHADCDYAQLEAHPIHVNYIWRQEELCTYPRLPAGHRFNVVQADGCVVEMLSEKILITAGANNGSNRGTDALRCCESYENTGLCYQGERCNFIHAVHVDPNVQGDFKRAPRKRDSVTSQSSTNPSTVVQLSPPFHSIANKSNEQTSAQRSGTPSLPCSQLASRVTDSSDTAEKLPSRGAGKAAAALPPLNAAALETPVATAVKVALDSVIAEKLQEAVRLQLQANGSAGTSPMPSSFSIAPTPYATQTLESSQSFGTLLYLPRGASVATVLGSVGASTRIISTTD